MADTPPCTTLVLGLHNNVRLRERGREAPEDKGGWMEVGEWEWEEGGFRAHISFFPKTTNQLAVILFPKQPAPSAVHLLL
jgi:hypothetical protein